METEKYSYYVFTPPLISISFLLPHLRECDVLNYFTIFFSEQFVKFHPEIIACACCWKSQSFVEIATFKFFGKTFCSMEVEPTWTGL